VIAAVKSCVVGWIFMGLDEAPLIQRVAAAAGGAALLVLMSLSAMDFGVRRDEHSPWQKPQAVSAVLQQVHPPHGR
jgi:hypothetical protein